VLLTHDSRRISEYDKPEERSYAFYKLMTSAKEFANALANNLA
jgi:hypothetical protein